MRRAWHRLFGHPEDQLQTNILGRYCRCTLVRVTVTQEPFDHEAIFSKDTVVVVPASDATYRFDLTWLEIR